MGERFVFGGREWEVSQDVRVKCNCAANCPHTAHLGTVKGVPAEQTATVDGVEVSALCLMVRSFDGNLFPFDEPNLGQLA